MGKANREQPDADHIGDMHVCRARVAEEFPLDARCAAQEDKCLCLNSGLPKFRAQSGYMSAQQFTSLPLHDALLVSITLLWEEKICRVHLQVFAEHGNAAFPHLLEFHGVELVNAPFTEPWGPSCSINSVSQTAGRFLIEMQSGDTIEVKAGGFTFVAL